MQVTSPDSNPTLTSGIASTICGDKKGRIFSLINNRIVEHDIKKEKQSLFLITEELSKKRISAICYGKSDLWIGTFTGLYRLEPSNHEIQRFGCTDAQRQRLSSQSDRSIIKDIQETFWIGTYFGGIDYFNPSSDIYQYYNFQTSQKGNINIE